MRLNTLPPSGTSERCPVRIIANGGNETFVVPALRNSRNHPLTILVDSASRMDEFEITDLNATIEHMEKKMCRRGQPAMSGSARSGSSTTTAPLHQSIKLTTALRRMR